MTSGPVPNRPTSGTLRNYPAIGLWIVALAGCIAIVVNTRFTADLSAFLPRAPTEEQRVLVEQLRDGAISRLLLIGIEGSDAPSRARISIALGDALRSSGDFTGVHNGDERQTARDRDYLFANRYLLSPGVTPERFTVEGLRAAIADSIDLLASPAGAMLKNLLPRDPTGEIVQLVRDLAGVSSPRSVDGAWASADGARALLLAQTRAAGSDIDGQQRAIERVKNAFGAAVAKAAPAPGQVSLLITGPGVFAVASRETIQREVLRLSIASTAIIVTLLLIIYRSLTALALGLVPVVSGALAAIAAVSIGFGEVHGLTLGFGTTLIGEAVDYSIYLFIQSQRTHAAGAPDGVSTDPSASGERDMSGERAWIARFWPTVRLGVLTSICGFATLLFSGFPGLAQLGLYSVTGLVVAALVTRFVLPSLLPRALAVRDLTPVGERLGRLVEHLHRWRWAAAVAGVVAVVALFVHRDGLWNRELAALSPVSAADQELDRSLRADLGAPDARYLVLVPATSVDAALAGAERAGAALQPLVAEGVIAGFESPARFMPSIATQRARQAALPDKDALEQRLKAATATLPIRAERLAPFVDDAAAARARNPLTPAELAGTSLGQAVDALLVHEGGRWSAALPLRLPNATAVDPARIRAALDGAGVREALFIDVKNEADKLYAGYLSEAMRLSVIGLVAIAVLLAVALRSAVRALRVIAPLLLAVAVVAGGLAAVRAPMTILHLIGMLLIVAVGSNYALFFERGPGAVDEAPAERARMLASLLAANLTTVAGFGLLALSSVPVLQAIGVTVGPGAMLALVFAAILAAKLPYTRSDGRADAHSDAMAADSADRVLGRAASGRDRLDLH